MLSAFDVPISWSELIKRTIKDANADNVLGLAAQLAYYFLLALVPAIACVVALTSFVPPQTIERMLQSAATVAPGDMMDILRDQLNSLRQGESGGVLSLGLLMALWSSSAALVAVTDALNRAYDIEEGRPWWKVRLLAIGLTIGLALFVVSAFTLVVAGPELAEMIASRIGLGDAFTVTWKIVQWPIAFALVALGIGLDLLLRPRCRPGLDLGHARLGARHPAVAAGVAGVPLLRDELRGLQRHLRLARGRDRPDVVVLHFGPGHPDRRRAERGDRARVAVRQGPGREGARREEEDWRPRATRMGTTSASPVVAGGADRPRRFVVA